MIIVCRKLGISHGSHSTPVRYSLLFQTHNVDRNKQTHSESINWFTFQIIRSFYALLRLLHANNFTISAIFFFLHHIYFFRWISKFISFRLLITKFHHSLIDNFLEDEMYVPSVDRNSHTVSFCRNREEKANRFLLLNVHKWMQINARWLMVITIKIDIDCNRFQTRIRWCREKGQQIFPKGFVVLLQLWLHSFVSAAAHSL